MRTVDFNFVVIVTGVFCIVFKPVSDAHLVKHFFFLLLTMFPKHLKYTLLTTTTLGYSSISIFLLFNFTQAFIHEWLLRPLFLLLLNDINVSHSNH